MKNMLGEKAKDKITGFTGIIVAKVEYLNGCTQYCLKPKAGKDGKMPEGEYIDIQQVELIDDIATKPSIIEKLKEKLDVGGPQSDCPK